MLSIAIPSRNEKFLRQTILDVLANATGDIEVFPILDGYEPPAEEIVNDPRVKYVRLPMGDGKCHKRQGINHMVDICEGEYVMSLDAHCMVAKGFDTQLAKDHQPNWVQVPRRHRLDAENWTIQVQSDSRPPIDYEYLMFPLNYHPVSGSPKQAAKKNKGPVEPKKEYHPALHGFKWDSRTSARANVPVDDTMTIQGSCWFMTKEHFRKMDLMQIEGFTGWGQEGEEISFKTWLSGGKVMTNKNTWYAHLHKGNKYGRMYFMDKKDIKSCNNYSYDFWINNRWSKRVHDFSWLIEHFWPVPNWPEDWKEQLAAWERENKKDKE